MTSTVLLAQAESVANWVSAVGTFAAVVVALRLARWERRRDMVERRDREAAQARLATLTVGYPEPGDPSQYVVPWVGITNHSEKPIHRPRIESIADAEPPVRWGCDQTIHDEYILPEELPAGAKHRVPFEHFSADGLPTDSTVAPERIKKFVDVDNVTITFTDTSGLRWRSTGNGDPVRVV